MRNRKSKEPSGWFIVILILLAWAVGQGFSPVHASGVKSNKQASAITAAISKISDCKILALNAGMIERTRFYSAQLRKFDNSYYSMKVHYNGRALGFLVGVLHQTGVEATPENLKKIATDLYFKQCGISF